MYKSRRGVDRSKKGLLLFFFPSRFWELSSDSQVAGGKSPSSRGRGAWKLSPGGKQSERRGLAHAGTPGTYQQEFLLIETLPVLTAVCSYSSQSEQ